MKFVFYQEEPLKLEAVGNGSYLYRWNIQEEEVEALSPKKEEVETKTQWKCYEIVVWATLDRNKITEAVIDAIWGKGIEQKLQNDYNAVQFGILAQEAAEPYKQFLVERDIIKSQVNAVCVEYGVEKEIITLELAKSNKLKELAVYDKSSAVNEFYVGEDALWVDRESRSSLFNSTMAEKNSGATTSTLYFGEKEYTYPIDDMITMLCAIELYAKTCYKVTQQHIIAIKKLTTVAEVKAYDISSNYPQKRRFLKNKS